MPSAAELLPALLVVAAVLGLAVGSFLNVVIHRLPLRVSLSHPGSRCPSCDTPIKARHNVPVLGWVVLRGRCHACRAAISVRYPLVEAGTAVAFVAVVLALVAGARDKDLAVLAPVPAWLWLAAGLIAAALIDLDGNRVPTRFAVLLPLVVAVLLVATAVPAGGWESLLRAAAAGGGVAGVAAVFLRGRPDAVGIGAAVGLAAGAVSWWSGTVGFGACVVAVVVVGVIARRLPVVALLTVAAAAALGVAAVGGY